jgi:hypothetical protein
MIRTVGLVVTALARMDRRSSGRVPARMPYRSSAAKA